MRLLLLLLLLVGAPLHAAPQAAVEASSRSADLKALADAVWDLVMEASPETAFNLGIEPKAAPKLLDDDSPEASARLHPELLRLEKRLAALEAQGGTLSHSERITLRQLSLVLRRSLRAQAGPPDVLGPITNPVYHLNARQAYFARRAGSPKEWSRIARVLEEVPGYVKNGRTQLELALREGRLPYRRLVEVVAPRQAAHSAAYFDDQVPARAAKELGRDPRLAARVSAAGKGAAAAVRDYAAFLKSTVLAKSTDSFAMGEAEVRWRLENEFGLEPDLDLALSRLDVRGRELESRLKALQSELAKEWGIPEDQVPARAFAPVASDAEALDLYRKKAEAAAAFVRGKGLFELPKDYTVNVAPAPAGADALGAFYQPVRILSGGRSPGSFFVALSQGDPKRLAQVPKAGITTTAAHEAVPGHDLQFRAFRSQKDRLPRTRWLTWSSANLEGWAMYATDLLRRNGYFTKAEEYLQVMTEKSSILLASTELAVQAGRLPLKTAVEQVAKSTGLTPDQSLEYMHRMYALPLQGTSYALGQLEIDALKKDYLAARGPKASEADFHREFLAAGPLPLHLVRAQLLPLPPEVEALIVEAAKASRGLLDSLDALPWPF